MRMDKERSMVSATNTVKPSAIVLVTHTHQDVSMPYLAALQLSNELYHVLQLTIPCLLSRTSKIPQLTPRSELYYAFNSTTHCLLTRSTSISQRAL